MISRSLRRFAWLAVAVVLPACSDGSDDDDPPPPPQPTRFQRLYAWLYEFNRY